MKQLENNKKHFFSIGIILLIGLVVIAWFREKLLLGYDLHLPLIPEFHYKISQYVWNYTYGRESANSIANLFPKAMYFYLMKILGIPLKYSEMILFYLLFVFSGVSMYYMVINLFKRKNNYIAAFFSGVFYMMNPYSLIMKWSLLTLNSMFAYAFFPLSFTFFVKGLKTKKLKYIFYFSISTLFYTNTFTTPTYGVILFFILLIYIIFYFVREIKKRNLRNFIFYILSIIITTFLINAWWFLPTSLLTPKRYKMMFEEGLEGKRTEVSFHIESKKSSLINELRMLGFWGFYARAFGDYYYSYSSLYNTPLFLIISMLIPFLVFSSLLFSKRNHLVLFFTLISLLAIFLMKGSHPPFGYINLGIFKKLPGFKIFRMLHDKFGYLQAFGYSFLLGFSILNWSNILANNIKRIRLIKSLLLTIFFLLLFPIYMFPFWTGTLISTYPSSRKELRVEIPNYYFKTASFFNNTKEEYKIYVLPFRRNSSGSSVAYLWGYNGGYFMGDLISKQLMRGVILPPSLKLQNEILEDLLEGREYSYFSKIMGMFNVKFFLLHNDFDIKLFRNINHPEEIREDLFKQNNLIYKKKIGFLEIFENKDFLPKIFSVNIFFITNKFDAEEIMNIDCVFKEDKPVILSKANSSSSFLYRQKSKLINFLKEKNNKFFIDKKIIVVISKE